MTGSTFKTNPVLLKELLADCAKGRLQLPDFQRGWVWDEGRIKGLIASIARAFPVGALMTLESGSGVGKAFAHRAIEGTPDDTTAQAPTQLLLDGQQRMTSLYQSCCSRKPVHTSTDTGRAVSRYFYIDIRKALANRDELESAILAVPEDKKVTSNFGRDVDLDLSTAAHEYEKMMYPVNQSLDWDAWYDGIVDYAKQHDQSELVETFKVFKNEILKNFTEYQVPVIALDAETSPEAVCLVFEKVNTGGKVLDAFELLTAMYAARGFRLRDDWLGYRDKATKTVVDGLQQQIATWGRAAGYKTGVLANVSAKDFLQAITLLHGKECRLAAERQYPDDREKWPAVRATRQTLLNLPLDAYRQYREPVLRGFQAAEKFLRSLHVYRDIDLPYQAQIIPLAAILAELGNRAEPAPAQHKLERWYWCGVFGELYGAATETRYARDVMEVPAWVMGGPEPATVRDGFLNPDRLIRLYSRGSAAYKGLNALLMREGAKDFRTGQPFDTTVFYDEHVDIHHIFPKKWCKDPERKIPRARYDSVVNKTPISYRTNRIIGGDAPSIYLGKLETGSKRDPAIPRSELDTFLATHSIPIEALRRDDFGAFMASRQRMLMELVCRATGQPMPSDFAPSGIDSLPDEEFIETDDDDGEGDRVHTRVTEEAL